MSDFEAEIEASMAEDIQGDVLMAGDEDDAKFETSAAALNGENGENGDDGGNGDNGENGENIENGGENYPFPYFDEALPVRVTFIDYLKSPIVELVVGEGEGKTVLYAHQALLLQSPFFEDACAQSDNSAGRRIELRDESLDALGCFLEYLYTGEYFPQKIAGRRGLAVDPSLPEVDETGEQLLKHARVYTLADRLGMGALKTLAHSKIHCVNSSAKGEIAYAKYVYSTTSKEDDTIRRPVASFWAHRSHVLRREAEDEFRQLCLEFPQFGYDVLTRVLDEKLKKEGTEKPTLAPPSSSRKRPRSSR